MAYDGRVYRILIASPADVEEEREIAVRVIQEWNDLHSHVRKVVLLPLRWETHTAPEYGTRPQEVINRTIVDECDLLVGIFWTRIGSPTGMADSGTLEEIERVGTAGKPIMLYFSRVEIDPEKIDVTQIETLKSFKAKTYPKGLVENYRRIIEFRDKFFKQLELKVRDLQRMDASISGTTPLSMTFISADTGERLGNEIDVSYKQFDIADFSMVPQEHLSFVQDVAAARVKQRAYLPIALGIESHSSIGIRSLYIELDFTSDVTDVELTDTMSTPFSKFLFDDTFRSLTLSTIDDDDYSVRLNRKVEKALGKFEDDKLRRTERGWRLSFEWDALQAQRLRLVKPPLFVYSPKSASLGVQAKIYSDAFPEPLILSAAMRIKPEAEQISLPMLMPKWEKAVRAVADGNTKKESIYKTVYRKRL